MLCEAYWTSETDKEDSFLGNFEEDVLFVSLINSVHVTGLFLYPLKTSENQRFSYVFRGYRKRPVAWNGLIFLKKKSKFDLIFQDKELFDSKKRLKSMSLDGLQHKLTKAQQVKMQKNICLLHLYTNQVFFYHLLFLRFFLLSLNFSPSNDSFFRISLQNFLFFPSFIWVLLALFPLEGSKITLSSN